MEDCYRVGLETIKLLIASIFGVQTGLPHISMLLPAATGLNTPELSEIFSLCRRVYQRVFESAFCEATINPNISWAVAPTLSGWKNLESCIGDGSHRRGSRRRWQQERTFEVDKDRQIHKDTFNVIIEMEIKWSPMTMIVMLLMMMDKQRNQAQFCCSNCNGVGEPSFKQALL